MGLFGVDVWSTSADGKLWLGLVFLINKVSLILNLNLTIVSSDWSI